jgi:hypothetical protein
MLKRTEPKRITLCDVDFAIFPFGAMKAANMSGELGKLLGPIVAGVLPLIGTDSNGEDTDVLTMDLSQAMPLVTEAFNSLNGDVIERLLSKLLLEGNISCEYIDEKGEKVQSKLSRNLVDEIFCQNVDDLYRLAIEVINYNYRGFFKKLLNRFGDHTKNPEKIVLGSTEILTRASSVN